jgi:hypothetical protein
MANKATGGWKYAQRRVTVGRIANPSHGEFPFAGRLTTVDKRSSFRTGELFVPHCIDDSPGLVRKGAIQYGQRILTL